MKVSDEITKTYEELLAEYVADAQKIKETYGENQFNNEYIEKMGKILYTRYINYLTAGRLLELRLINALNKGYEFKKAYRQMDKMLNKYLKDLDKIYRKEVGFRDGLKMGTIIEHEKYLDKFRRYEREVK